MERTPDLRHRRSKITLPRELLRAGYRIPNDNAHCPQGMVSVLYRLRDRIPVDFDLFGHENERAAAVTHLGHAAEGDVIVCDRGYWSFEMALLHRMRKLNFVFRIQGNANPAFNAFINSEKTDSVITLKAPRDAAALRGQSPPHPPGQTHRRRHHALSRDIPARSPAPQHSGAL